MEEINPYQAPRADERDAQPADVSWAGGAPASGEITADEVRTFVGPRASSYLNRWWGLMEGRETGAGFNWAAFFLLGFWFPYRKMYKLTLMLYGIVVLESVLEEGVFTGILQRESPQAFGRLFGFILTIYCAANANKWYFRHARREILTLRAVGFSDSEYAAKLARRGGTNLLASLGMFALFILALFAIAILEQALFAAN